MPEQTSSHLFILIKMWRWYVQLLYSEWKYVFNDMSYVTNKCYKQSIQTAFTGVCL